MGEGFDFAFIVHAENEQGAIDGFGERTGKDQFASFAGFAREAQVFFAEGDAAIDHIVDEFVEQGVVVHRVSPTILNEHMKLDGQEPIVLVRFAAGLDGYETGAQPRGDRGIRNSRELQVAVAVTDARDGSDDGGRSGAEGFGEFSSSVSGENFVDGDLAFFGRDADLAKQSESRIARDAGKNRAAERRSDCFAIQNEEYVHDAGFFDIAALNSVQPQDIVKAFFLGEARGEKASGVVAGSFAVTGSAAESAHETFFSEKTNRLRKIRANGRSHDDEAKTIGGSNKKCVIDSKVSWPDVEGTAFTMGDPIAIEPNQFGHAIEEERLWNFGHGQARGGAIHASEILARAEQREAAVRGAVRFEAFEDGLTVVERSQRGRKRDRAEGNDLRLLPRTRFPIGHEHVVAEGSAKLGILAQRFCEPGW